MLPEQLRSYATSLKVEKGEIVSRVNLLAEMLSQLEYWYKALIRGRKDTLLDAWLKLDSTVGKSVRVQTSEGIIAGIAEGISSDGELIIKQMSGAHTKVYAGEVTILKN
jgi:BirA family biotin operon repressor/biotin-[acetyl-CoA-carboxylase] ligase